MLSGVDDVNVAVLSSRAEVRMQQRFTPTTPNLISIINQLALGNITESQINKVVYFIVRKQYNEAANYMINNNLSKDNLTATRTTLSSVANSISQQLRFPVAIANPDDINYVINSNNFTYNGINCALRNKLNSNTLQIVNAGGTEIIVDNIGNYVPNTGVVTINFFNPSNVTGGDTQIKLSAVPANQSAVAPTRNDYLLYDPNRSTTTAVIVSALN